MQIRRSSLLLLAVVVIVTGCRATGGSVTVDVRNVSPAAITLVIEQPGPFLLSDTNTHVIQPWQEGKCFAHLGLYNGHIKLTVSGSNITAPATYEKTTPTTPTGMFNSAGRSPRISCRAREAATKGPGTPNPPALTDGKGVST